MTEDKLSVELVIVTCGNVVVRLPIAVSIISLHKTLEKPVIVSNSLFFVLKHFQIFPETALHRAHLVLKTHPPW